MIATYPFQQVKQWLPTWGRLTQWAVVAPVNTPTL